MDSTRLRRSTGNTGYAGVLYLNKSKSLAQTILALGYPSEPTIVWVNAVAPNSWESIVIECGFNTVDFVSAIPVSLTTGEEGEQVEDDQAPMNIGEDLICGSLIVIEISDGNAEEGKRLWSLTFGPFPQSSRKPRPRSRPQPSHPVRRPISSWFDSSEFWEQPHNSR